jgi:hypothetical protein
MEGSKGCASPQKRGKAGCKKLQTSFYPQSWKQNHGGCCPWSTLKTFQDTQHHTSGTTWLSKVQIHGTAVNSALFDWRESKSKGEVAGAILFDLSSAFHVVDANILVAKLSLYGLEMTSCL